MHSLGSQFRRCLDQNLALVLTDEEFEELMSKYDNERKGMINYIDFIESVQACKNLHVSNACFTHSLCCEIHRLQLFDTIMHKC